MIRRGAVLLALGWWTGGWAIGKNQESSPQALLERGHYREALEDSRRLLETTARDPGLLEVAVQAMQRLRDFDAADELLEGLARRWSDDLSLTIAVAGQILSLPHQGTLQDDQFRRGHRSDGRFVYSLERDRVRALQLLVEGWRKHGIPADPTAAGAFYQQLARALKAGREGAAVWRLQTLTSMEGLPEFDESYWHPGRQAGAPVTADGKPVFHGLPASFDAATSDGERWRLVLDRGARLDSPLAFALRWQWITFLRDQFGVQTLVSYGPRGGGDAYDTGPYAVHSLSDDETIARLATGTQRFALPADQNYIRLLQAQTGALEGQQQQEAWAALGTIYENRRQFARAAEAFGRAGNQAHRQQIVGNWGRFEATETQPAGSGATLQYRYRNGRRLQLTAHALRVDELLADLRAELRRRPRQLDRSLLNLDRLGHRLVVEKQDRYRGDEVAQWSLDLEPLPGHQDRYINISTPLQTPGAYLLTAQLADGNASHVVVWVADTVLLQKRLAEGAYYFVADARTGEPVAGAQLDLTGYRWTRSGKRQQLELLESSAVTDAAGGAVVDAKRRAPGYDWLVTARTKAGRLAFLGFQQAWYPQIDAAAPTAEKTFWLSDRPVYRPGQTVRFHVWTRQVALGQEAGPGAPSTISIFDARGDKVYSASPALDRFGGLSGELRLPEDAALGVYRVHVAGGGGQFRVEEYRKPEFEVVIESPAAPVMLGEVVTATVQARYYHGAPVRRGTVRYTILRHKIEEHWFPPGPWDWLYGKGFGWQTPDPRWYPGSVSWGCRAPLPWWFPAPSEPPELVAQQEVELGPDGTVPLVIQTDHVRDLHGDSDHRYEITAEVVDESRRAVVGQGSVTVARQPFAVFVGTDRGFARTGQHVKVWVQARTADGKPLSGQATLAIQQIKHVGGDVQEQEVERLPLAIGEDGSGEVVIEAVSAGQYRLVATVTSGSGDQQEGAVLLSVYGDSSVAEGFRFNDLELVVERATYRPGDTVRLRINSRRPDVAVLVFVRPQDGSYPVPELRRLDGKSEVLEVAVEAADVPNFFVEVMTVADGRVLMESRQIAVPPQQKLLQLEVRPSAEEYRPGETAELELRVTDATGEPVMGQLVVTVYDRALEAIAGGSNVAAIAPFFWSWRRHHTPATHSSLERWQQPVHRPGVPSWQPIGIFGHQLELPVLASSGRSASVRSFAKGEPMAEALSADADGGEPPAEVPVQVRQYFADTACYAVVEADPEGRARLDFTMPDDLTAWQVRIWGMGEQTRVGEAALELRTRKPLFLRSQAPRFLVTGDRVMLSANVHNDRPEGEPVTVTLEVGAELVCESPAAVDLYLEPGGEERVDWWVRAEQAGEVSIRMSARGATDGDAVLLTRPVRVHGMLRTESFSGVVKRGEDRAAIRFHVPEERRPGSDRIEIRYTSSLAGALVEALPYLASYPYGCTEQTVNRFVPTLVTRSVLRQLGIRLADLAELPLDRSLPPELAASNPIDSDAQIDAMIEQGLSDLREMQLGDGGFGWFSGYGERSSAHLTALVMHGLLQARSLGVAVPADMLNRCGRWLQRQQAGELEKLRNGADEVQPWKRHATNLDVWVDFVLQEAQQADARMLPFLYRDRLQVSAYAQAMLGLTLDARGDEQKAAEIQRNLEQFLIEDAENQTAYLKLSSAGSWWYWYGSEYETQAYYLKLLARREPTSHKAAGVARYLINQRRYGSYWTSTRDSAICVEALAAYLLASGEQQSRQTVSVVLDGVAVQTTSFGPGIPWSGDQVLVLTGADVTAGDHVLEVRREGAGPVYFNAFVTSFSLEDPLAPAGLEIKVQRRLYRLTRDQREALVRGARGQVVPQETQRSERAELDPGEPLPSGTWVEVELLVDSKNDYEYILLEDFKAANLEAVEVRSGYQQGGPAAYQGGPAAYVEYRDDRVALFLTSLPRGQHRLSYLLRAEAPGRCSALPARVFAMYAPQLRANSAEHKVAVTD